jgi:hypothetical protein
MLRVPRHGVGNPVVVFILNARDDMLRRELEHQVAENSLFFLTSSHMVLSNKCNAVLSMRLDADLDEESSEIVVYHIFHSYDKAEDILTGVGGNSFLARYSSYFTMGKYLFNICIGFCLICFIRIYILFCYTLSCHR